MKLGVGVLFVAIGLVILWLAVTGRLSRLSDAWTVLKGDAAGAGDVQPVSGPAAGMNPLNRSLSAALNIPAFPTLPVVSFSTASNN